jgi:hypothetical protein
MAFDEAL